MYSQPYQAPTTPSVPARPPGLRYARLIHDLRPGEGVLLLRRRHPYFLLSRAAGPALLLVLWATSLLFLPGALDAMRPDPLMGRGGAPGPLIFAVGALWVAVGAAAAGWGAYALLGWLGRWMAITTRRIIVMDRLPLIRESRREAPIQKVQNVVAEYPHLLGTTLDFGTVTIDTAGVGVLLFSGVAAPRRVREAIFAQQAALRQNRPDPEERRRSAIRGIMRGGSLPAGYTQPTRIEGVLEEPDEESPSLVWRKHPYFFFRPVALPLLTWLGAVLLWLVLGASGGGEVAEFAGWAAVLGFPPLGVWALWCFEDWRNDLYVIDAERVYHVESLPLGLREQSKETLISRVTDVTYTIPGPLANLLGFGDVLIKTPGEATEFRFAGIGNPREVHAEIMNRVDAHRLGESAGMDGEIEGWLRAWHEVAQEGP